MPTKFSFTIKSYVVVATAASLMIFGCNQKPQEKMYTATEKDSLIAVLNARDSSITDFLSSFNEIEQNLDSVAIKQHIIRVDTKNGGELQQSQKSRINSEIKAINSLMDKNRKKIAELNRRLANSSNKNTQLEKTISTLNAQLEQKNAELIVMNEMLNALYAEVQQLEVQVGDLKQTVSEQTDASHVAYYVVGKRKDLQEAKVIDRKGGLLGIGKTSKIVDNVDNGKFRKIDYTQTTKIAVNSEDMKLVTSHSSDSYTLEKGGKDNKMIINLVITNAEKFWSASKYLVIVKD